MATLNPSLASRLEPAARVIGRYGLVLVLLWIGIFKFTPTEAEGIRPLVEHSPFMSWLYRVASVNGVSRLIGTVEVIVALLIAARPFAPRASAIGSLAGAGIFLITLSFLFTTPGVFAVIDGIPALAGPGQFLLKDLLLLAAALASAAEALRATPSQRA